MGDIPNRVDYALETLNESDLETSPFKQFENWYQRAVASALLEPNSFVLGTVGRDGQPTQRTVLLKYFDESGFVFFTNYGSRKATQIAQNAKVSMLFQWLPLQRQLEINGHAEKVTTTESLRYFATRPRGSQLGAWVSYQSQVISSRSLLESKLLEIKDKFKSGAVPLPQFWGGYRVIPSRFEFWQGRPSRLHDRFQYQFSPTVGWTIDRLSP